VDGQTSIGPAEAKPAAAAQGEQTQTTVEGVDAHDANEFDMRHGLAGAEAKPFNQRSDADNSLQASQAEKQSDHEAASSEPVDDPNRKDPNERSDMISERRNLGQHNGGGAPARKPGR
jgi:hypothetical protein